MVFPDGRPCDAADSPATVVPTMATVTVVRAAMNMYGQRIWRASLSAAARSIGITRPPSIGINCPERGPVEPGVESAVEIPDPLVRGWWLDGKGLVAGAGAAQR